MVPDDIFPRHRFVLFLLILLFPLFSCFMIPIVCIIISICFLFPIMHMVLSIITFCTFLFLRPICKFRCKQIISLFIMIGAATQYF